MSSEGQMKNLSTAVRRAWTLQSTLKISDWHSQVNAAGKRALMMSLCGSSSGFHRPPPGWDRKLLRSAGFSSDSRVFKMTRQQLREGLAVPGKRSSPHLACKCGRQSANGRSGSSGLCRATRACFEIKPFVGFYLCGERLMRSAVEWADCGMCVFNLVFNNSDKRSTRIKDRPSNNPCFYTKSSANGPRFVVA